MALTLRALQAPYPKMCQQYFYPAEYTNHNWILLVLFIYSFVVVVVVVFFVFFVFLGGELGLDKKLRKKSVNTISNHDWCTPLDKTIVGTFSGLARSDRPRSTNVLKVYVQNLQLTSVLAFF